MKVLVVGANGKIGSQVVDLLETSEAHSVTAFVRKENQVEKLNQKGIDARLGNLEGSVADLEDAVRGMDAVVFSAGSGGNTGAEKTLLIDLDGAVKVMEAAQNIGVDRFILVSAFGANNRNSWTGNEDMAPYYVAKYYADKALEQTSLTYTIIRPGGLLDEPSKGSIKAGDNIQLSESDEGTIPREDVAKVIVASLENDKTYRKAFDLITGEQSIEEALDQL